jgi:hypothetical protein
VCTVQEEHGRGKRLIRLRYRLRPSGYTKALGIAAALSALAAVGLSARAPAWLALVLVAGCLGAWWRGIRRASHLIAVFDELARSLGLLRFRPEDVAGDNEACESTGMDTLAGTDTVA